MVEVARSLPVDERVVKDRLQLYSSDAHQLGAIMEPEFDLFTERFSLNGLFDTLMHRSL